MAVLVASLPFWLGGCYAARVPVQVSEFPPIYLVDDFASAGEMEEMYRTAEPRMKAAEVMNSDAGLTNQKQSDRKAKAITLLTPRWTDAAAAVARRMDAVTMRPHRYGQHMLITRYDVGDYYNLHVDSSVVVGRQITAILFLEEPERGGELVFPWAERLIDSGDVEGVSGEGLPPIEREFIATDWPLNDTLCGENSEALRIRPRAGRLVVFHNHNPMGQVLKPRAFHASCPVLAGRKRLAQRWYQWWPLKDGNFDPPGNHLGNLLRQVGYVPYWVDMQQMGRQTGKSPGEL